MMTKLDKNLSIVKPMTRLQIWDTLICVPRLSKKILIKTYYSISKNSENFKILKTYYSISKDNYNFKITFHIYIILYYSLVISNPQYNFTVDKIPDRVNTLILWEVLLIAL